MIRRELESFLGAVRFFTRIPVPDWVGHSAEGLNRSARYFPAVGLLVGGLTALVFGVAAAILPTTIAVLLSMLAGLLLTGAFHEDGLADMVDGFGGGWTREDRLRIMKDSRVGSYGAIAVALAMLLKFSALTALPLVWVPLALVAGHTLSRFLSTLVMCVLEYARENDADGKSKPLATQISAGGINLALVITMLGLAPALFVIGYAPVVAGIVLAGASTWWLSRKFHRHLGGYTGDCLGAVQQVSEILFLIGLLCSFT